MNWLRRIMYGRNGVDHLALASLTAALALNIIVRFLPWEALQAVLLLLDYILLVLFFFRTLSRNVYKRQQENQKFLQLFRPIGNRLRPALNRIKYSRTFKYFKCPRCGLQLRAPRGKGRIRITCQQCGEHFEKTV